MKYLVVIEKQKNEFWTQCPDILGCISRGDTVEEAIRNMTEAVELHLEGEDAPEPHDLRWHLTKGDAELSPNKDSIVTYISYEPKIIHEPTGNRLHALRKKLIKATAKRGSKQKLSSYLNVPPSRLSDWLSGKVNPSGEIALALNEWLEKNQGIVK